jgi:hypothetical protein
MLKGKCPSAKLCYIVEPWFLGAGKLMSIIGSKRSLCDCRWTRVGLFSLQSSFSLLFSTHVSLLV